MSGTSPARAARSMLPATSAWAFRRAFTCRTVGASPSAAASSAGIAPSRESFRKSAICLAVAGPSRRDSRAAAARDSVSAT